MPRKRGQHTDPHTQAAQEALAGDAVLRAVRDAEHAKRGKAMRYAFARVYGTPEQAEEILKEAREDLLSR